MTLDITMIFTGSPVAGAAGTVDAAPATLDESGDADVDGCSDVDAGPVVVAELGVASSSLPHA